MEQLLTYNYGETLSLIWEILQDPASRPKEAMLIFAIVVITLLIIMFVVILFILRRTDDESVARTRVRAPSPQGAISGAPASADGVAKRRKVPAGVMVAGAVLLWWFATGLTTLAPSVCESCHPDNIHAATSASADPHGSTSCVRCHEVGGYVGALTIGVPGRVVHMIDGALDESTSGSYGFVTSGSCNSCHSGEIAETTTDDAKAVRVSHVEPIDAGAECLDCHRPFYGVVGVGTTKMAPCLRCHDDEQASAGCSECHTGDIGQAIAGRSQPTTATAQVLVPNPDCGGCHSQETCDACHGIRMPHTQEFRTYAHAREGVEDLWFNGGRTCSKCHNDDNRPCTECHKGRFPSHGTDFSRSHSGGSVDGLGCDNCHSEMAYRPRRNFCVDLCHQEE